MLKRFAEAIDPRDKTPKRRRAILEIAARDFATQLTVKTGSKGGTGYDGWKLSNMCHAAFWAMLLLSQRRERFAIRLLGQMYKDTKALRPYVAEKRATLEVLEAVPGIDADSLIGFVDVAITQLPPAGVDGGAAGAAPGGDRAAQGGRAARRDGGGVALRGGAGGLAGGA